MPAPEMLKAVIALLVVLALIALFAWVMKKGVERKWLSKLRPGGGTLSVKETLYLDARHRIIVVADGETEHLILLGPTAPVVVNSRPAKAPTHA